VKNKTQNNNKGEADEIGESENQIDFIPSSK
jgi:hypothetical protein